MDSRRADVGDGRSGQPPQRKLRLLHQSPPADAKTWPRKRRGDVVWQQRETPGEHKPTRSAMEPRETHPRDSDKLWHVALDEWIASADQALRTLTGGAHAARPLPTARRGRSHAAGAPAVGRVAARGPCRRGVRAGAVPGAGAHRAIAAAARSRCSAPRPKRWTTWRGRERRLRATGRPHEPAQPAVVRRCVRHRPARRPGGRSLEPGLRGRNRAPGRAAPGRPPRSPAERDAPSRAIVEQMKLDEAQHAEAAQRTAPRRCRRRSGWRCAWRRA